MEAGIDTKQTYLRNEIIDKGYDPNTFHAYLTNANGGNDDFDLDQWSMNDLISLVSSFKQTVPQPVQENNNNNDINQQATQQESPTPLSPEPTPGDYALPPIGTLTLSKQPVDLKKDDVLGNYSKVINCIKSEQTQFTDMKDLKIIISNPELIKEGIFSSSYYQFTLTCQQTNTSTKRKMSDFEKFTCKINAFYPGVMISYFPSKRVFEKKSNQTIEKKLYYIQLFIDSICQTKVIRSSILFHDFITQSTKDWEKTMLLLDKNNGPTLLTKFTTTKGTIDIEINPSVDAMGILIEKEYKTKSMIHDKITLAFSHVMNDMSSLSNSLMELSSAFNEMSKEYSISQIKNEYIENSYKTLGKAINDWSESYKKQREFFKFELRFFFKYIQKEMNLSSKVIDSMKTSKGKYVDFHYKLSKLPGITTQQHNELVSYQNYFGYYLHQTIKEYKKMNKRHMNRIKNHLESMAQKKANLISDLVSFNNLLNWQIETNHNISTA